MVHDCLFRSAAAVLAYLLTTIVPWYGGVQNVWGEENVPENALSRKFLDPSKRASGLLCRGFLYRKNRAVTPEGGGKRTVRGGSKTPFWEGCHSWGFPPPSFFHPPMASSDFKLKFAMICDFSQRWFPVALSSSTASRAFWKCNRHLRGPVSAFRAHSLQRNRHSSSMLAFSWAMYAQIARLLSKMVASHSDNIPQLNQNLRRRVRSPKPPFSETWIALRKAVASFP